MDKAEHISQWYFKKKREAAKQKGQEIEIRLPYHYLYRVLCFEYRITSIPYFLDEALLYEFDDAIDYVQYTDRSLWETARLLTYVEAQVHSKKSLEMTDLLKFPWENTKSIQNTDISKSEIKRLRDKAAKVQKMLQRNEVFDIRN